MTVAERAVNTRSSRREARVQGEVTGVNLNGFARLPVVVLLLVAQLAGCSAAVDRRGRGGGGRRGRRRHRRRGRPGPGGRAAGRGARRELGAVRGGRGATPVVLRDRRDAAGRCGGDHPLAPLDGAEVRITFDPATELPEAEGRRATVDNAYLAVFNPGLDTWIPLPTRFEDTGDGGELVAATPHFSLFRKFVVDPAKAAWSARRPVSKRPGTPAVTCSAPRGTPRGTS